MTTSARILLAVLPVLTITTTANAQSLVSGGQTSVLLNADLLDSAAGLTIAGVSAEVLAGDLGSGSVAFPISSRVASPLPTTFEYDSASFPAGGSFSGTIEHKGSVFLDNAGTLMDLNDDIELGDFTIGFDGTRVTGNASGFFVQDNKDLAGTVVFDIAVVALPANSPSNLVIDADLLIAPELADALGVNDDSLDLVVIGDARVAATAVPEPGSILLTVFGAAGLVWGYRRLR